MRSYEEGIDGAVPLARGSGLAKCALREIKLGDDHVGLRQCSQLAHPEACDVNRDGACNIGEALGMAQCDVGLVSCVFTCNPFACQ